MSTNPNPFLRSPFDTIAEDEERAAAEQALNLPGQQATIAPLEIPEIQAAPVEPSAPAAPSLRKSAKSASLLPPPEFEPLFIEAAKKHGVPVNVLMAIGQQESSYNPGAQGMPTKWGIAKGMMQYLPGTAKGLGIDANDPAQAIDGAARQIRERLDAGMKMKDAIKEHFAGPDRAQWGAKTDAYGDEVMGKVREIGKMLKASAPAAPGKAAPNAMGTAQSRDDYQATFMANNPQAKPEAVKMAMDQYDVEAKARAAATPVADKFAQMADPNATFDARLDAKLATRQKNKGVVPGMPSVAQPAADPMAPTDEPSLINDVQRGARNLQATGFGLAALAADATGYDEAADKMLAKYVETTNNNLRDNPAAIGSYKNVETLGDAGRYAVEAVLENAAMIIPSLVTGGIGAMAARKGAEKIVGGMISQQVAKGVAREVAERNALAFIARRATMGAVAGAVPASVGMEAGSIMGDIYSETGQKASGTALAGGALAGTLDSIGPVLALRKIVGPIADDVAGHVLARLGKEVGTQFLAESLTEGAQTFIEKLAVRSVDGKPVLSTELLDEMIDATLKGGIGGAVMGGASQAVSEIRSPRVAAPIPAEAAPKPVADAPLTAAITESAEAAPRVVAASPDAQVAGELQSYIEDETGRFTAQVLDDDGNVVTISDDGVTEIIPVEAESGPLSSALGDVAAGMPDIPELTDVMAPADGIPELNDVVEAPAVQPVEVQDDARRADGRSDSAVRVLDVGRGRDARDDRSGAVDPIGGGADAAVRGQRRTAAGSAGAAGPDGDVVGGDTADAIAPLKPSRARADWQDKVDKREAKLAEQIATAKANKAAKEAVAQGKRFSDEVTGAHSGQTNHRMTLRGKDGKPVGSVEYTLYEGKPQISMIDVPPENRRKGFGAELVTELQRKFPDVEIDWGGMTDDGTALRKSLDIKSEPSEFAPKFDRLEKARAERDALMSEASAFQSIDKPTDEQRAEYFDRIAPLNDLHDEIDSLESELNGQKAVKNLIVGRKSKPAAQESEPQATTKQPEVAAEKVPEVAPKSVAQEVARAEMVATLADMPTAKLRDVAANHKRAYMRNAATELLAQKEDASRAKRSNAMKQRMQREKRINPDTDTMLQAIVKMGGINRESARGRFRFAPEEMNIKAKVGNLARHVFVTEGGMRVDQAGAAMADLGYVSMDENGKHDQSDWEDLLSRAAGGEEVYTAQGMIARAEVARSMEMEELQAKSEAEMAEIEGFADDLMDWADDNDIVLPDAPGLYLDHNDQPLITEGEIDAYFNDRQEEDAGAENQADSEGQARASAEADPDSFLQSQDRSELEAKAARAADQGIADRELADAQVGAFSLSAPEGSVTGEANAMSNSRQNPMFSVKGNDDYRDEHRAPSREEAAPLSDLTGGGMIYPDDVYSAQGPRYYGTGNDAMDKQAFRIANMAKGKPNFDVMIFRAVPSDVDADIGAGDWVTINKAYAEMHGEARFDGDYKILSKMVRAKDIFTNGDSIQEWGYDPEDGDKFSTGKRDGAALTATTLREAVTTGPLGSVVSSLIDSGQIVLHDTTSTLPKGATASGIQAVTTPDGKVHLVASSLTRQNARAVLLHEAFHQGGQQLIGTAQWDNLMRQLGSMYRQGKGTSGAANKFWKAAKARVDQARAQGAVGPDMEAEEFGAYAIEEYESAPPTVRKWVDSLVGMVKAWLVKRFGKQFGNITPAQLSAMAKMALYDAASTRKPALFELAGEFFSTNGRTIEVDGVRRPITNSKGQLLAPDFSKQVAFWKWFGSSAVVDGEKPLVVYHGTDSDFDKAKGVFWAAKAPAFASMFSDAREPASGQNVMPVYLKIEKPMDMRGIEQHQWLKRPELAAHLGVPADEFAAAMGDAWDTDTNPMLAFHLFTAKEFVTAFKRMGYDGVLWEEELHAPGRGAVLEKSPTYATFNATQVKSATGNNGDYKASKADMRYSVASTVPGAQAQTQAQADEVAETTGLTPPPQGFFRKVQAAVQDNMNRLKQTQEHIEKITGVPLRESMDAYGAFSNRPGRVAARIEDGELHLFEPLMERLAKAGHTMEQLADLLHAMHAKERNKHIRSIDPTRQDGSGMSDKHADEILKKYADDGFTSLHKLADDARAINRAVLQMKLDYGLIEQEDFDHLTTFYQHYVPLKGGDRNEDGSKRRGVGAAIKRAMGHSSRDEHILENIQRDFKMTVSVGERNLAKMSLLRLMLGNPDPKLWTVGVPPKGRRVVKENGFYVVYKDGMKIARFDNAVEAERQSELYGVMDRGRVHDYSVEPAKGSRLQEFVKPLQENEDVVMIKGRPVRFQINDEALAKQLMPMTRDQLNMLHQLAQWANRQWSKMFTGYNPTFIFTNMARDIQTGSLNMIGNYGAITAGRTWVKHYGPSLGGLIYWAATGKLPKGKLGVMLNEYRMNGGKVGASHIGNLEDAGKSLQTVFDNAKGVTGFAAEGRLGKASWLAARKSVRALARVIEIINQGTENALRLALYTELRDQGASPSKAAQAAKSVTVDFDRRGASTSALSAAYLFFNPAVQGTANATKTIVKGKHKGQAMVALGGYAMLAYFFASLAMDEDKDKWLGAGWDERTKFLLINVGERQIRIPLSQEFAPFYALGVAMAETSRGEKASTSSIRLLSSVIDAYVPLRNVFVPDSDNPGADIGMALVPTLVQVPVQIAANRNAFGSQLFPESQFTKDRPDNLKMNKGTKNTMYDKATQGIASAGVAMGAGKYENDITKISPETLKLIWSNLTGGVGTFVADSLGVAAQGMDDNGEVDLTNFPITKSFVREPGAKPLRGRYYDLTREARKAISEFEAAKKAGDIDAMAAIRDDENKDRLIRLAKVIAANSKAAGAKRDEAVDINADASLTPGQKRAALKELDKEEQELYREAIEAFKN